MDSSTTFLASVRQQMEKNGTPAEIRQNLLGLLEALLATLETLPGQNNACAERLVQGFLDNNSLLVLISQQAAELDAIKRISLNLTSSLDLQAVLDGVVLEAMKLVQDANDAHIFLYNNQKIVFGASLKVDGTKNEVFAEPREDGLTYHVASTQQILVVEDVQQHELYKNVPTHWMGSIIGIPLKMGDRVIGVMNLARTRCGEFSRAEIRLLTLLADQAAIAIINARLHQAVSQQARIDMLTGLPNRRALDERLEEEIKRSTRHAKDFCAIMMDLDGFKLVNDTHGHDVGDEVLKQVSLTLRDVLRGSDFLARYGGDELTLLLPETDLTQALMVIEKIQDRLKNLSIQLPGGNSTHMAISGGIAVHPRHARSASGLLRAADEALYLAKRSGGNRFQVAQTSHA